MFFFFNDTATTEIYTLSLHDALPILPLSTARPVPAANLQAPRPAPIAPPIISPPIISPSAASPAPSPTSSMIPRAMRSEEHTSELQSQSNLVCRLLLEKKKDISLVYSVVPYCNGETGYSLDASSTWADKTDVRILAD